jgi:hypothetical protein
MPRSTSSFERIFTRLCRHLHRRKRHQCLGACPAPDIALARLEAGSGVEADTNSAAYP